MNTHEIADNIINWGMSEIEIRESERIIYLFATWDGENGFRIEGEILQYVKTIPPTYTQDAEDVWIWKDVDTYRSFKASVFEEIANDYGFTYEGCQYD